MRGDIVKAIYACKLYRASSRQDKIKAAIEDPLNLELVTQLKSYLDDEYQEIIDRQEASDKADLADNLMENTDTPDEGDFRDSNGSSSHPAGGFGGPSGSRPSLSEKFDMLMSGDEDEEVTDDTSDDSIDDVELDDISDSPELDDVEESTTIEGVNDDIQVDNKVDIVEEVKTCLNSDVSTQGINRVIIKKNELWIHYNDDINLNNVMGPVIEKLSTYNYMDFNRLARSENAIVFQMNNSSIDVINEEGTDVN